MCWRLRGGSAGRGCPPTGLPFAGTDRKVHGQQSSQFPKASMSPWSCPESLILVFFFFKLLFKCQVSLKNQQYIPPHCPSRLSSPTKVLEGNGHLTLFPKLCNSCHPGFTPGSVRMDPVSLRTGTQPPHPVVAGLRSGGLPTTVSSPPPRPSGHTQIYGIG